jgi:hypothetical protein
MNRGATRGDLEQQLQILADRLKVAEARSKALEAALLDAAQRLRRAAIAGGSDAEYADLAVAKYFEILFPALTATEQHALMESDTHKGRR